MDVTFFTPKQTLTTKEIISLTALMQSDVYEIISLAKRLETMESFKESTNCLKGANVVLLTNTRVGLTRLLFKIAVASVGGNEITLPLDGTGIEGFLSSPETAAVLHKLDISSFVINTSFKNDAYKFSGQLKLPIINANEQDSPVQALAMILTVFDKLHKLSGLCATIITEQAEITNLATGLAKSGVSLNLVTPAGVNYSEADLNYLKQFVDVSAANEINAAGADIVFIDCPTEKFRLTKNTFANAKKDALLLHNAHSINYNDIDKELIEKVPLGEIGKNYMNIERAVLALVGGKL